ncbi:MAG: zinc ABC transporter ATP-binding protein, partial [Acinetobacter guillouiae]
MSAVLEQSVNSPLVQLQQINVRIDDRDILKN